MRAGIGIDTSWLVEIEIREHANHQSSRTALLRLAEDAEILVLAPQVLAEFVHAVTDSKRFQNPLSVSDAIDAADNWWTAKSVLQVFPTPESVQLGFQWMRKYNLGRKRVLDTQLAATFYLHGITRILTSNDRDYRVFGCFELL